MEPLLSFLSTLPARGATAGYLLKYPKRKISIHAPREGSDLYGCTGQPNEGVFLSTLPARGATYTIITDSETRYISIHAPREGSDNSAMGSSCTPVNFYPRSPRGERRSGLHSRYILLDHFYPRSPRGERPMYHQASGVPSGFLSTLPARGATGEG